MDVHSDLIPSLLDSPVEQGALRLALSFLGCAARARKRVLTNPDRDALHDLRVALRRLRSTLRTYGPFLRKRVSKKSRRRLRRLMAATGESRDFEVVIAWLVQQGTVPEGDGQSAAELWMRHFVGRKAQADKDLHRALARPFRTFRQKLINQLELVDGTGDIQGNTTPGSVVLSRAADELAGELRSRLACIHGRADVAEAHQARIAAKRLRYVLEPAREFTDDVSFVVDELKRLQDLLGEVHDSQALRAELEQARELFERERAVVGLSELVARVEDRETRAFTEFTQAWSSESAEELFVALASATTALSSLHHGRES